MNKATDEIDTILLTESADDDGNAHCLHRLYGEQFFFTTSHGWLYWAGTHWRGGGAEAELERAIFSLLKRRRLLAVEHGKEAIVKATAGSTKRMADCKRAFSSMVTVGIDEFDSEPDMLNVANGILDLRSGELSVHSSERKFTYCIAVAYDEDASDKEWRAFLAEVVGGGPEMLCYLQMAAGYSFTGHTNEECLWYVWGPTRSGKGTFTETLLALLPYPLGLQADFSTFTSERVGDTQNFDLAPLKPARLVVAGESRRYESLNEAKIKSATGGDYIRCAYKYHDHFSYRPQFKIWLVSNHTIRADVDDDAIWYRLKVVEFPHGHNGAEDKDLKARLRSPAAQAGALRWVVDGARQWYDTPGGLQDTWHVVQATQKQREALDHVQLWLNECVSPLAGNFVSNAILRVSYEKWCDENGHKAYQGMRFAQSLEAKGFERESRRIGDKVQRGFTGLILSNG